MLIKDLKPRQNDANIEAEAIEVSPARDFNKPGRQGKVATAILKDESGTIKLSLWNEQVEKVHVGDMVKIDKGYVNEWQGELQLTTGKFGTLEITSSQPAKPEIKETPAVKPASKKPADEDKKEDGLDVEEEDMNF